MCKNNTKFIPSKELIDLQKVELDLLKEFIRVCNKYNINLHISYPRQKASNR